MNTYTAVNFFDASVWQSIMLVGILFASLILANILKARIPFLGKMLIPNAVLGGVILLIISGLCYAFTGTYLFNMGAFSDGSGINILETITYHCLAIGFIAMTLRPGEDGKRSKKRTTEILNTGIATIGTYMFQAIVGIVITMVFTLFIKDLAPGSGILMCFGYGQGTGQALNIGKNFDTTLGTGSVYASIGLALAALGFLSACFLGVPYLNILRKRGLIDPAKKNSDEKVTLKEFQGPDEPPLNESIDKMTVQIALVFVVYMAAYGMMYLIGNVIMGGGGMIGTIYGFNFLFGVIAAVLYKNLIKFFKRNHVMHREYCNTFLLNRISGFAFDLMIVSGVCAIQIHLLKSFIVPILILGLAGAAVTFYYQRFVTKHLFPEYEHFQFLAFFGMLTGTASTGMILLREADPDLKSPVSENLVYQNLPAIVLAIPLLFIASAITNGAESFSTALTMLVIIVAIFIILNLVLFRSKIFKKKAK